MGMIIVNEAGRQNPIQLQVITAVSTWTPSVAVANGLTVTRVQAPNDVHILENVVDEQWDSAVVEALLQSEPVQIDLRNYKSNQTLP